MLQAKETIEGWQLNSEAPFTSLKGLALNRLLPEANPVVSDCVGERLELMFAAPLRQPAANEAGHHFAKRASSNE